MLQTDANGLVDFYFYFFLKGGRIFSLFKIICIIKQKCVGFTSDKGHLSSFLTLEHTVDSAVEANIIVQLFNFFL